MSNHPGYKTYEKLLKSFVLDGSYDRCSDEESIINGVERRVYAYLESLDPPGRILAQGRKGVFQILTREHARVSIGNGIRTMYNNQLKSRK